MDEKLKKIINELTSLIGACKSLKENGYKIYKTETKTAKGHTSHYIYLQGSIKHIDATITLTV